MILDEADRAMLESGGAAGFAMGLMVRFAQAVGAPHLIDAEAAHVDGCLYHGRVNLDFVEHLVRLGGRVAIPTTLNVGSVDLIHPELFRGRPSLARDGARLMAAHEALGCVPTYTCAPYQTLFRPGLGAQLAWAESNAIVFANSVLGARTNRYGDFIDLCGAIAGRVPYYGLHVTANRRATVVVSIDEVPAEWDDAGMVCITAGHLIGKRCGDRIPAVLGLPRSSTEDDLKALGAAAASAGAVAMFHAVGLTPEAATLDEATQGQPPDALIRVGADELREIVRGLSTVPDGTKITAVSLGTPHFSLAEFTRLLHLVDGRFAVDVYVNTGRDILAEVERRGWATRLRQAGVIIVVDTCAYITAIIRDLSGAVMTNSGKMAYYAPGNLGVEIAFGSLAECVASARAGRVVRA